MRTQSFLSKPSRWSVRAHVTPQNVKFLPCAIVLNGFLECLLNIVRARYIPYVIAELCDGVSNTSDVSGP